jgi:hypothetical protein
MKTNKIKIASLCILLFAIQEGQIYSNEQKLTEYESLTTGVAYIWPLFTVASAVPSLLFAGGICKAAKIEYDDTRSFLDNHCFSRTFLTGTGVGTLTLMGIILYGYAHPIDPLQGAVFYTVVVFGSALATYWLFGRQQDHRTVSVDLDMQSDIASPSYQTNINLGRGVLTIKYAY